MVSVAAPVRLTTAGEVVAVGLRKLLPISDGPLEFLTEGQPNGVDSQASNVTPTV